MNFENIHISATNSTIQIGEHISYNQPASTKVVEVEEAEVVEEPVSTEVVEKRRGRSQAGNSEQSLSTSGVLFAYIDMTGCTPKEAQQAEAMLRQVAQKSPKEIAGVVRRLQQAHRLRTIDSKAGFVREFNNHFGVQLKETSFYSAFK